MAERRAWVLATACLLLGGCGGGARAPHAVAPQRQSSQRNAARGCVTAARLAPGVSVPAWRMGAVHFFSATRGIGITAGGFPCFRRTRHQAGVQRQSVRLASTIDGGRSWRIEGPSAVPVRVAGGLTAEQIAATSPADVWALVEGRLLATPDGGSDWHVLTTPRHVVQLATSAGVVWALTCLPVAGRRAPSACRPQLWRTKSSTTAWTRVTVPRTVAEGPYVQFTAMTNDVMIVLVQAGTLPTGQLLVSHDAGRHWAKRPAPAWDQNRCDLPADLTAAPPRTFWLLCLGGAAAGSSTKGLLRSTDGGRTWITVSAVTSLTQPARRGSIPRAEPSDLAAGSPTRLWLSQTNALAESNDGGRRWANVPQAFDSGGWGGVIDALNASDAWLLAPGAGIWRTTNGLNWRPMRPLNTG